MHIIYVMRAYTELRKNISIDQKTWERLKSFGKFGDSFDSLLNRLMDIVAEKTEKSKK
jgi:predicted CopG family antitoxin